MATTVPCFLADAPVLTPSGYKPIGTLRAGDDVQTADGRVVQIVEACHYSVAATKSTRPFVIPQGRFGATQDLHISPRHRVLVEDGSMVEALRIPDLQQDTTIDGTIEYYNLELPDWQHDTMVVAGVTVESKARIERLTVTVDEFKALLQSKYGVITPELLNHASQSCRFVAGGFIEVPLIRRK